MQAARAPTSRLLLSESSLHTNLVTLNTLAQQSAIMAMVKANAYGHGLIPMVRKLIRQGVKSFGVATLDEALSIRHHFKSCRIFVWTGIFPCDYRLVVEHQITPIIFSLDGWYAWLAYVQANNLENYPIHLELDTGISRSGLTIDEHRRILREGIPAAVNVEALATHYSASEADKGRSLWQRGRLLEEQQRYNLVGAPMPTLHSCNSGGILNGLSIPGEKWVRPGLMLYGYSSVTGISDVLRPIATLQARVIRVKEIEAGEGVSYNSTFVAKRKTLVATLGIGYADGLPRELGNKINVSFGKFPAPVIGTICMDLVCVDVTEVTLPVVEGQWATLFGQQGELIEWAKHCRTIPYEILCGIGNRVKREWVE